MAGAAFTLIEFVVREGLFFQQDVHDFACSLGHAGTGAEYGGNTGLIEEGNATGGEATEVLLQQMAFFGRSLNKQDEENRQIRERGQREMFLTKNMKLFSELPEDFAKNDLIMLRRQHGIEGECAYIISRWVKVGIVERNGNRFLKRQRSAEPLSGEPLSDE